MKLRSGIWLDPISMDIILISRRTAENYRGEWIRYPIEVTENDLNSNGWYFVTKL